jgi:hypothetical protein
MRVSSKKPRENSYMLRNTETPANPGPGVPRAT